MRGRGGRRKSPGCGEGGSRGSRCEVGLENNPSRAEQACRGLRERDFREDKTHRTFSDLKLLGGFTLITENLRRRKHSKDRQFLTQGGDPRKQEVVQERCVSLWCPRWCGRIKNILELCPWFQAQSSLGISLQIGVSFVTHNHLLSNVPEFMLTR